MTVVVHLGAVGALVMLHTPVLVGGQGLVVTEVAVADEALGAGAVHPSEVTR
jgi:hypothetical protein